MSLHIVPVQELGRVHYVADAVLGERGLEVLVGEGGIGQISGHFCLFVCLFVDLACRLLVLIALDVVQLSLVKALDSRVRVLFLDFRHSLLMLGLDIDSGATVPNGLHADHFIHAVQLVQAIESRRPFCLGRCAYLPRVLLLVTTALLSISTVYDGLSHRQTILDIRPLLLAETTPELVLLHRLYIL